MDNVSKIEKYAGLRYKLSIWDTAGQEAYHSLSRNFYRGCHGVILTYSIDDKTSFEKLAWWVDELKQNTDNANV